MINNIVFIKKFIYFRPQTKGRENYKTVAGEVWPSSEMVQIIIQENSTLKLELDRCYKKIAKTQKLN